MGVASMVIGIIALVIGFIPFCGTWALVPAVVGLGLGIGDLVVRSQKGESRGMAITGVILNPLAIVVILGWYLLAGAVFSKAMDDPAWQQLQQQSQQQPGAQPPSIPTVPIQPAPPGQPSWPAQPVPSAPPPGSMQPMQPMQPVPPPAPAPAPAPAPPGQ